MVDPSTMYATYKTLEQTGIIDKGKELLGKILGGGEDWESKIEPDNLGVLLTAPPNFETQQDLITPSYIQQEQDFYTQYTPYTPPVEKNNFNWILLGGLGLLGLYLYRRK